MNKVGKVAETNNDLGLDFSDIPTNSQLDEDSRNYWWGWFWFISAQGTLDILLKHPIGVVTKREFCEMGFEDAKGAYERRREMWE